MSSPSTLRRNAKRREEFLKRKTLSEAAAAVTGVETNQKQDSAFQCDQCDATFKTENGLKITDVNKGWFSPNYINFKYRLKNRKLILPWLYVIARSIALIEGIKNMIGYDVELEF